MDEQAQTQAKLLGIAREILTAMHENADLFKDCVKHTIRNVELDGVDWGKVEVYYSSHKVAEVGVIVYTFNYLGVALQFHKGAVALEIDDIAEVSYAMAVDRLELGLKWFRQYCAGHRKEVEK